MFNLHIIFIFFIIRLMDSDQWIIIDKKNCFKLLSIPHQRNLTVFSLTICKFHGGFIGFIDNFVVMSMDWISEV